MPSVKPPGLAGTVLAVLLCVSAAAPALAADSQPQPSSGARPNLVCHPSDPTDCYPRVFQPTYDFQV
ncbi:nucleotide exchange factor sil1, partial [Lasius niger]